jgi:pimeloyl-ACP methyl ester carboxylesterase
MLLLTLRALAACLVLSLPLAAQTPTAITTDNPPDKDNPPAIQSFQIPSHGSGLNALMYLAAGAGPHPVVILLHGFPGNEKNLDLAQSIRRAGWDVLYFDYRGSWGTPGDFSFTHAMEDAQAAIAYVRDPANATKLRADPKQIVLIGHSMGGMIAAWTAAHDPAIEGVGLISAANMADRAKLPEGIPAAARASAMAKIAKGLAAEGIAPLAGCTPESLAADLAAHASEWSLVAQAGGLSKRPVLIVTSDDGLAPVNDALASAIQAAGGSQMSEVHIATDHSYSGTRIELEKTILAGLAQMTQK